MPDSPHPIRFLRSLRMRALLLFRGNFDWRITGQWMIYSAAVGVVGALSAILFSSLVELISGGALVRLAGYHLPLPGEGAARLFDFTEALSVKRTGWLLVVPALGGIISGGLISAFASEAAGEGMNPVINAFHNKEGRVRERVSVVKMMASVVTIGTGGSAGQEGPIAQISASLGSMFSKRMGLSAHERRILLVAGIAAGISSIFRAPLGGAFFAVEVLYREDIETEALMPAVVAGITGYSIYSSFLKSSSVFTTPEFSMVHPLELLLVIVFALGCTVIGYLYVRFFHAVRHSFFDRLALPLPLKAGLGGLFVGVIGVFFPAVLGTSYGWLQQAINGNLPVVILGTLALTKILATSFTIGSGGSGGLFAPSLVIGGMLGGMFGQGADALFPTLVTEPDAYVMIGMATFFAGVANVPVAATIMITELTGRYTLLVPLIFGSVIIHLIARNWSLYGEQVSSHHDSPAHSLELATDLLSTVHVKSVIERAKHFHTLSSKHTLGEMLSVFTRTREVILPVAEDEEEKTFSGLVLLEDVQSLLQSSDTMQHLVVARDLEVPFRVVHLDDTLEQVLNVFVETDYPELPVCDADDEIVGFVRQGQVIHEYHRAFLREKAAAQSV